VNKLIGKVAKMSDSIPKLLRGAFTQKEGTLCEARLPILAEQSYLGKHHVPYRNRRGSRTEDSGSNRRVDRMGRSTLISLILPKLG